MKALLDVAHELVSAWNFMWATPRRRLFVWLPVLLNLLLWAGVIPSAYFFARWLTALSLPDTSWAAIVSVLVGFFAVVAVMILAVFVFTVLTTVIGAPFYGFLAEEVLRSSGRKLIERPWYREMTRALVFTLKLGVLFVSLQLFLFVFNIVPVIGTLLHIVGAFVVALLLLSMEFFSEAFAKTNLSFREQIRFLLRHHERILAFAVPVFFLLLIPGLNLFIPPLAVVAASKIYAIISDV